MYHNKLENLFFTTFFFLSAFAADGGDEGENGCYLRIMTTSDAKCPVHDFFFVEDLKVSGSRQALAC